MRLKVKLVDAAEVDVRLARFHPDDQSLMKANLGDIVHIAEPSWWHGGLRSANVGIGDP